jgi:hypothetical protein
MTLITFFSAGQVPGQTAGGEGGEAHQPFGGKTGDFLEESGIFKRSRYFMRSRYFLDEAGLFKISR